MSLINEVIDILNSYGINNKLNTDNTITVSEHDYNYKVESLIMFNFININGITIIPDPYFK